MEETKLKTRAKVKRNLNKKNGLVTSVSLESNPVALEPVVESRPKSIFDEYEIDTSDEEVHLEKILT